MEWKEIQKRQSVPEKKKKIYNALAKAQFETWNRGSGYYYWSYKLLTDTVNTPDGSGGTAGIWDVVLILDGL